jgi:hypothetical protein
MTMNGENGGEKPTNGANVTGEQSRPADIAKKNPEPGSNGVLSGSHTALTSPTRNGPAAMKRPAFDLTTSPKRNGGIPNGQTNGVTPMTKTAANSKSSPFQEQPTPLKSNARKKQCRRSPAPKQAIREPTVTPLTAQEMALSAARGQAGNIRYSWDSLRLGSSDAVGTGAYNALLRNTLRTNGGGNIPQLTPFQTLQIVQALRPPTVLPPQNSGLEQVLEHFPHNYRFGAEDHKDEEQEEENYPHPEREDEKKFMLALARAYQTMCDQDVDTGVEYRQHLQYTMTPEKLPQELQRLDETIVRLNEREKSLVKTSQSLGLNTSKVKRDVSYFLGFTDGSEPLASNLDSEDP